MKLYKVLGEHGEAFHGGQGRWYLPEHGRLGKWMPAIEGPLVACKNGYHLCRLEDLPAWLGPTIWAAEHRGEIQQHDDKVVVREARLLYQIEAWNERTARLFACACAEHVAHLAEDERCAEAIQVARRFADGEAGASELAAARDAAMAAAMAAARGAARGAAWGAAWGAARGAAWGAARGAAWGAARGAARGAAMAAARDAARAAARGAAWAAERKWQAQKLAELLDLEMAV